MRKVFFVLALTVLALSANAQTKYECKEDFILRIMDEKGYRLPQGHSIHLISYSIDVPSNMIVSIYEGNTEVQFKINKAFFTQANDYTFHFSGYFEYRINGVAAKEARISCKTFYFEYPANGNHRLRDFYITNRLHWQHIELPSSLN